MKNIGLIDDKDRSRRAFMLKINLVLEKTYPDWKILDSKPFADPNEYRQWILENDISVLITDERLDEEKLVDGTFVKYFGSDLVKNLRDFLKDLPVYCITNIEITEKLKNSLSYFNLILSRSKFDAEMENYLNLFIKSGISFYNEFSKELARLGELSAKIASDTFTQDDIDEMQALQTSLIVPHITDDLLNREKYLEELEGKINEIKTLQDALVKYLDKGK